MSLSIKAVIRATLLALVVALAFTPVASASASSTPTSSADARATSACVAATNKLDGLKDRAKKVKKKRKAARKKFRKAKRVDRRVGNARTAKVKKKTRAKVKKFNKRFKNVKQKRKNARAAKNAACKPDTKRPLSPQQRAEAEGLGGLLALLTGAFPGAGAGDIGLGQLTGLLDSIVPGLSEKLDPAQLTALLDGFNGFDAGQIGAITDLFGDAFDPAQLTDLFGGGLDGFDPADLMGIFQSLADQLGGMAPGGFEIPEFTPEGLLGAVGMLVNVLNDNLLSTIGLGAVGDLLVGLLSGGSFDSLDPTQLAELLTAFDAGSMTDQLNSVPVLGAIVGGLLEQAGGSSAGLPSLDDIPVLGPILGGLLCILPLPVLCS